MGPAVKSYPDPEVRGPLHFLISSFRMGPAVKSYQTLKSEDPYTF